MSGPTRHSPPACEDCGDPAETQVRVGSVRIGSKRRPRYAWLCPPCGREVITELRWSQTDD